MSNNPKNTQYYKKLLELEGIKPNKKLGQNFIFDKNILNKIVSLLDPYSSDLVIEIGPGLGGLTETMLNSGFKNILLIEKDRKLSNILIDIKSRFPNNLDVQFEDALNFDFTSLNFKKISVISNLPYNVATKILTKLLFEQYNSKKFDSLILMFQREVAERIVAKHSTKNYGRLSIISQYLYECSISFNLNASVFYPKPKVESSIVAFNSKKIPSNLKISTLEEITRLSFNQRRKMIKSNLKNIIDEKTLKEVYEINPNSRPENISAQDYVRISQLYEKLNTSN
jgi:16S rRNA (adenine1518-N6/adenine1519-N6)-dimethyltransferase